jgi:L-amino acid N-acyltransferase
MEQLRVPREHEPVPVESPQPRIRQACIADLPAIVEIYNQGIEDGVATCDLGGFNAEQKRAWFDNHKDQYRIWVAERNRQIIGWTALSPYESKPCFARTAMFSTYVRREARGQKIGTLLRHHLIQQAREIGFHTILNRVWATNRVSIGLAKKFGFTQVGHMRDLVCKDGEFIDCFFFQLILEP